MSSIADFSLTGKQLPAPNVAGVAASGWSEEQLNRLLGTLQFIFDELHFDRAEMLRQIAKHTEMAIKRFGPPPPYLRQWLLERVNSVKGYDHLKSALWAAIVPSYGLVEQGQPHEPLIIPCKPDIVDNPMQGVDTALLDMEAYRWHYAIGLAQAYVLYRVAWSLAENNRVNLEALFEAVPWSQAYTYRLLSLKSIDSGDSLFYRARNEEYLYLRSGKQNLDRLTRALVSEGLSDVLDGRKPGNRKRYVPIHAPQHIYYDAWADSKKSRPRSLETDRLLWGLKSKMTIRRWRRDAGGTSKPNYAQTANLRDERIPADREDCQYMTINGTPAYGWRRANTYIPANAYREAAHKGQARKERRQVNVVLDMVQPAEILPAAHPYRMQNFYGGGNPLQAEADYLGALRKPDATMNPHLQDFVLVGERQAVRGNLKPYVWELAAPRPGQDTMHTTARQYVRGN